MYIWQEELVSFRMMQNSFVALNHVSKNAKIRTCYCSKTGDVRNLIRPFQVHPKELKTTKIENGAIQCMRNILILNADHFQANSMITWVLPAILVAQKIATET